MTPVKPIEFISVEFDAIGVPAPQGSKSAFVMGKRAVIVDGTSKTGRAKHIAWRDTVTQAAMQARGGACFEGPVIVKMKFFLPLPTTYPHRTLHATKPDLDKLIRSVLDSLTVSGLIKDDSLVCQIEAKKIYARAGHWTGASIEVIDVAEKEKEFEAHSRAEKKLSKKA